MRVLITGSRKWTDVSLIEVALESVLRLSGCAPEDVTVVHGDCPDGGADIIAAVAAEELGMVVVSMPADWAKYGKKAGPIRNQAMVDAGADICLAFPLEDSRGTVDCVKRAEAAGIPVKTFKAFR